MISPLTHVTLLSLAFVLMLCGIGPALCLGGDGAAGEARVPLLSNAEAWKRLPPADAGGGQPLPSWARALAGSLPQTTAVMLELDRTYRTSDALDPRLAGAIRLVVARTIRSEYGRAQAEADLRRLEMDRSAIDRLTGDRAALKAPEQAALAFAERMTTAGYTSTDAEVAALVEAFGEAKVVAIVLQIAYSNFLYRMALALGLPVEAGGPLPPIDVQFAKPAHDTVIGSEVVPAPRPVPVPSATASAEPNLKLTDPEWSRIRFEDLQHKLEVQRDRKPRVSIPTWEEFRQVLPENL
jgi:alkylhydroperoxidase family enzyme